MRWASIETEISSKIKKEETALAYIRSVYGREGGKFNKEKTIKVNLMHRHFIHNRTSHSIHTLHQIYVFLSKIGIQSKKGVSHPIKASERPSGRKKVIQTDRSFQRISNPYHLASKV